MAVSLRLSPNAVDLAADYIKVVEDRHIQSATEVYSPNSLVFRDTGIGLSFMTIFAEFTENDCIIERHLRDIHPLLDYDGSESLSMISI